MCSSTFLIRFFLFFCFFLYTYLLQAQQSAGDTTLVTTEEGWETGASIGLNFSQVNLTNWVGGGQSSVSFGSLVALEADYARGHIGKIS